MNKTKKYHNISKDKSIYNNIIILLLCSIVCLANMAVPTAYAQEIGLQMEPSVMQIKSLIPGEIEAPFTIENQSNEQVLLNIGYKIINKSVSQEGIVTFLNDTDATTTIDKTLFEKMQVIDEDNQSRDSITLGPKQKKHLKLRLSLPKDTPTTDYYFSLLFVHSVPHVSDQNESYINQKDQKSVSTIQTGIALNVFLSAGPESYPQGSISEFSTPFYTQESPIRFSAKVTNAGTHYITPKGEVIIRNIFGQKIDSITIPSTIVLSHTTRSLTDNNRSQAVHQAIPEIVWQKKFMIGYYTANLHLALSPQGPYYSKTIPFIIFPLVPLISLLITLPIVIFLYIRIKKKLRLPK